MYKLDLEKAEESEIKLPTYRGWSKKQEFQKSIYFCFIDYAKAFDCVDHSKLWKILQEMGIPDYLTWLLRNLMQVKKPQLELDMFYMFYNRLVLNQKRSTSNIKPVYCHPAFYMQSASFEMPGWMKHKLESRLQGEISITSDMQMTPPYGRQKRRAKEPLDESERGAWKNRLKTQHSEN